MHGTEPIPVLHWSDSKQGTDRFLSCIDQIASKEPTDSCLALIRSHARNVTDSCLALISLNFCCMQFFTYFQKNLHIIYIHCFLKTERIVNPNCHWLRFITNHHVKWGILIRFLGVIVALLYNFLVFLPCFTSPATFSRISTKSQQTWINEHKTLAK